MYIAVYNDKGGSCKSTFVREISLFLERKRKKILVVDLDYKNSITQSFDIKNKNTISPLLEDIVKLDEVLVKTEYIDLIPGDYNINNIEIKKSIREHIKEVEENYDYIFYDTSCENMASTMAIYQSEIIVVPVIPERYDVQNLKHTIKHIKKSIEDNQSICILIMRYDDSETSAVEIEEINKIAKEEDLFVFKNMIRDDDTVKEIQLKGKELRSYNFVSDASEDYKSLTEEFIVKVDEVKENLKEIAENAKEILNKEDQEIKED